MSEQPGGWSTEVVRNADGCPVRIEQRGGDVFVIVAKSAPRGRIRLGADERDEFMHAYADAERRAEAWEAAHAAGTEG